MNPTQLCRRRLLSCVLATGWTGLLPKPAVAERAPLPADDIEYIDWDLITTECDGHDRFRGVLKYWLDTVHRRFAQPVELREEDPGTTILHVPGLHPALAIAFAGEGDINVHVTWEGISWDILASFEVWANTTDGSGWRNVLLVPEAQELHRSREVCWITSGLEPLLSWFNEELAPATHLALLGAEDSWTSAHLVQDGRFQRSGELIRTCDHIRHLLPLHVPA